MDKGEVVKGKRGKRVVRCPVLEETRHITTHSKKLVMAMGRLRRSLKNCKRCENHEKCNTIKLYHQIVNSAITEVLDEWNGQEL